MKVSVIILLGVVGGISLVGLDYVVNLQQKEIAKRQLIVEIEGDKARREMQELEIKKLIAEIERIQREAHRK